MKLTVLVIKLITKSLEVVIYWMNIDFIQMAKEIEWASWIEAGAVLYAAIMIPKQMKHARDLQDREKKLEVYKTFLRYLPNILSSNQQQFNKFADEVLPKITELFITIPEDEIVKEATRLIDKRINGTASSKKELETLCKELETLCKELMLKIRSSFHKESKITIEDNIVRFLVNNSYLKEDMRDGDVENIRAQYIKLFESLEPIILAKNLQGIDVKAICEKVHKQQLTLLLSGSDATIGSVKQLTSNLHKILDDTSLQEDDKKRLFLELQKSAHEIIVAMRKDLRSDSLLHL